MTTAMYCLTNATNSQQYCQGDQVVGKTVLVMENLLKANKLASYSMLVLLVYCWLLSASTISIRNKALEESLLAVGLILILFIFST